MALESIGGLLGRNSQNNAARQSADAERQGNRDSNATNWSMFGANAQLNDWQRQGGGQAYNEYLQLMGLSPVDIPTANSVLSQYNSQGRRNDDPTAMQSDGIRGNYNAWVAAGRPQNYDPLTGAARTGTATTSTGTSSALPTTGYTTDQVLERIRNTPGYAFRMGEGQRSIEASAASRGGLNSGAALRSLARYGQDYGSNEFTNHLNRLSGLYGGAQTASQNLGNAATNFGQIAGQNAVNSGNARAGMYQQIGNNNAGFYGGVFGALNRNMNSAAGGWGG